MSVSVRAARLENDCEATLSLLRSNLGHIPHERRHSWLYRCNPDGQPWVWFAVDNSTGKPVGVTSVFPRAVWLGERLTTVGQVGDFAIAPGYRSLGPAVQLQRATFGPVIRGELSFCYDCPPHEAGMSTFRRLKMKPNAKLIRYALPLRVDRQAQRLVRGAAAFPAAAANLFLRAARAAFFRNPQRLEIDEHSGPFGSEFTELDEAVKHPSAIRGCRSAAHLNWRYCDDPLTKYHVLTARRGRALLAFLVLCLSEDIITVVDLFGRELQHAPAALLRETVRRFAAKRQTIEAFASENSESAKHYTRLHFRPRAIAANVVAYAQPGGDVANFLMGKAEWNWQQAETRA